MDELNEEELKGVEGGGCKIFVGPCYIVKESGTNNRMWLRAGWRVDRVWIKEICFKGHKTTMRGYNPPMQRRYDEGRVINVMSDGYTFRIQFRHQGIINVMVSKSGANYIKLLSGIEGRKDPLEEIKFCF